MHEKDTIQLSGQMVIFPIDGNAEPAEAQSHRVGKWYFYGYSQVGGGGSSLKVSIPSSG